MNLLTYRKRALLGVFLDTETNGLNWLEHTVLEISFIIKNLITGEEVDSYTSMVLLDEQEWQKSDPESLAYTGITFENVIKNGKDLSLVRKEILEIFKNNSIRRSKAVFICQNPSFDRVFFSKLIDVQTQEGQYFPYYWLDLASMYWSRRIAEKPKSFKFSIAKDAIAKSYGLPEEARPHRALGGVEHLISCYDKVVGFPKKDSPK